MQDWTTAELSGDFFLCTETKVSMCYFNYVKRESCCLIWGDASPKWAPIMPLKDARRTESPSMLCLESTGHLWEQDEQSDVHPDSFGFFVYQSSHPIPYFSGKKIFTPNFGNQCVVIGTRGACRYLLQKITWAYVIFSSLTWRSRCFLALEDSDTEPPRWSSLCIKTARYFITSSWVLFRPNNKIF